MCAKVLLLTLICLIGLSLSKASPLQHLSEIDLQDISTSRDAKSDIPNIFEQDEVDDDSDYGSDEIKAVTAAQVSPIISGMLGQLGTAIQPLLGPLAPLSNILGPMITSTVTDLVTGLLNRVAESANRNDFAQTSGYDTYMMNIPNQGSYILLSKGQSQPQQVQHEPIQSSYSGTLEEFLAGRPITGSSGSALLSDLKGSAAVSSSSYHGKRPVSHKKKIKKIKKKQNTYVIPMKGGNALRPFAGSRSSLPLSDYELEFV